MAPEPTCHLFAFMFEFRLEVLKSVAILGPCKAMRERQRDGGGGGGGDKGEWVGEGERGGRGSERGRGRERGGERKRERGERERGGGGGERKRGGGRERGGGRKKEREGGGRERERDVGTHKTSPSPAESFSFWSASTPRRTALIRAEYYRYTRHQQIKG